MKELEELEIKAIDKNTVGIKNPMHFEKISLHEHVHGHRHKEED